MGYGLCSVQRAVQYINSRISPCWGLGLLLNMRVNPFLVSKSLGALFHESLIFFMDGTHNIDVEIFRALERYTTILIRKYLAILLLNVIFYHLNLQRILDLFFITIFFKSMCGVASSLSLMTYQATGGS